MFWDIIFLILIFSIYLPALQKMIGCAKEWQRLRVWREKEIAGNCHDPQARIS